jgi:RNA polymerase sigma-70 factor (ECF subfamily)
LKNDLQIQNLLDRISRNGDEKALQQLFELYGDGLLRFSVSIIKKKELAEEVVCDVFFQLWLQRKKASSIENIKAYLFTATKNTTLNYLEKEKRVRFSSLDDISVTLPIDEICPETELISAELRNAIEQAIQHLPERCKLIFSLAKIEQFKYKEIAQILGISVKTIDHQLTIAIKKIGETIEQHLKN